MHFVLYKSWPCVAINSQPFSTKCVEINADIQVSVKIYNGMLQ